MPSVARYSWSRSSGLLPFALRDHAASPSGHCDHRNRCLGPMRWVHHLITPDDLEFAPRNCTNRAGYELCNVYGATVLKTGLQAKRTECTLSPLPVSRSRSTPAQVAAHETERPDARNPPRPVTPRMGLRRTTLEWIGPESSKQSPRRTTRLHSGARRHPEPAALPGRPASPPPEAACDTRRRAVVWGGWRPGCWDLWHPS